MFLLTCNQNKFLNIGDITIYELQSQNMKYRRGSSGQGNNMQVEKRLFLQNNSNDVKTQKHFNLVQMHFFPRNKKAHSNVYPTRIGERVWNIAYIVTN